MLCGLTVESSKEISTMDSNNHKTHILKRKTPSCQEFMKTINEFVPQEASGNLTTLINRITISKTLKKR